MNREKPTVYPYIPNSVPAIKEEMLEQVGAQSTDEFYEDMPENLRFRASWTCPPPSCPSTP